MARELPASTQVLIVGAGPVGLTLATALAREGIAAVLIDKIAEGANTSRAAVVHARTLEVLRDLDVTDELLERGVVVPTFTVRERDRVLLTVEFGSLPTEYPFTLMAPRNITEEVLLSRLRSEGGDVSRPYELTRLEQDHEGGHRHPGDRRVDQGRLCRRRRRDAQPGP